jgi:DNA polymerase III epsilon subunit-like protein
MPNLLPKPVPISDPTSSLGYLAIDLETTDFPGSPRAELFSVSWLVVAKGKAIHGGCLGVENAQGITRFLSSPPETVRAAVLKALLPRLAKECRVITYGAHLDRPFLEEYMCGGLVSSPLNLVCVYQLARRKLPDAPFFAPRQLAKYLGINADDVPLVLRDAMITARLFEHLKVNS